jgi:hypothetical protein
MLVATLIDSFWNIPDLFSVTGSLQNTTSAITSEDNHFSSLQNTLLAITSEHRASWEWTSAAFWEVPQSKAMYVRTKTNAIYCLLWGGWFTTSHLGFIWGDILLAFFQRFERLIPL